MKKWYTNRKMVVDNEETVLNNGEVRSLVQEKMLESNAVKANNMKTQSYCVAAISEKNTRLTLYETNFSIPVFVHIIRGKPAEKIVWLVITIALLTVAIYLAYDIRDHKIFNSVSMVREEVVVSRNDFPSVTFCIERKSKFLHCDFDLLGQFPYGVNPGRPCNWQVRKRNNPKEFVYWKNVYTFWENGEFEVACLRSKKCRSSDISKKYITTSSNIRGKCITWNPNGTYQTLDNEIELMISVNDRSFRYGVTSIEAIIHPSNVDGTFQHRSFRIDTMKSYDVNIKKTLIKRNPKRTNCAQAKLNDIFPKGYSLSNCFNSLLCKRVLQKCGETFDFCRDFIPKSYKIMHQRNGTLESVTKCFREFNETFDRDRCQLPCTEEKYEHTISGTKSEARDNQFSILLKYNEPYTYEVISEKNSYVWKETFCIAAGLFVFIIGPPVLFLMECFAYTLIKLSQG